MTAASQAASTPAGWGSAQSIGQQRGPAAISPSLGARFDTHAHVWHDDAVRYPWMVVPPAAGLPDQPWPAESLLAAMDRLRISRCVLVQPSTYGWRNDYLLDVVRDHPGRFVAVVLVDPADPASPGALAALASVHGVRGVRFHLLDEDQAATFRANGPALVAAAFASGLVVTLQVRPEQLPVVRQVLGQPEDAAAGAVVIDHLGLVRPGDRAGAHRLLALAKYPSVFVKLSGVEVLSAAPYPFADCAPLAAAVVGRFGAARVMWGSNFPHVLRRCAMHQIADLVRQLLPDLSEPDRMQIECLTAHDLWMPGSTRSENGCTRNDAEE